MKTIQVKVLIMSRTVSMEKRVWPSRITFLFCLPEKGCLSFLVTQKIIAVSLSSAVLIERCERKKGARSRRNPFSLAFWTQSLKKTSGGYGRTISSMKICFNIIFCNVKQNRIHLSKFKLFLLFFSTQLFIIINCATLEGIFFLVFLLSSGSC